MAFGNACSGAMVSTHAVPKCTQWGNTLWSELTLTLAVKAVIFIFDLRLFMPAYLSTIFLHFETVQRMYLKPYKYIRNVINRLKLPAASCNSSLLCLLAAVKMVWSAWLLPSAIQKAQIHNLRAHTWKSSAQRFAYLWIQPKPLSVWTNFLK